MSEIYARLKPFDPKREHAMRVFVLGQQRFDAGVWMPVPKGVGDVLRTVRQSYYDNLSPLAFDVCSEEQAAALGFKPDLTEGSGDKNTQGRGKNKKDA